MIGARNSRGEPECVLLRVRLIPVNAFDAHLGRLSLGFASIGTGMMLIAC